MGEITTHNLSVGSSGVYDRNTTRDSQITGTLNIMDGAILNVGVGKDEPTLSNSAYVGFGNASNTGIINISGPGSQLNFISDSHAQYLGYAANGALYLGYIGRGIINVTDGGTLSVAVISASTTLENRNQSAATLNPPSAEINVSGAGRLVKII